MPDRSLRASARSDDRADFVRRLRRWLDDNEAVLAGLVRLRKLPKSEAAVDAVLEVPELLRARLSWELWEALVAGDGEEPDSFLLGHLPLAVLEAARVAFWGDDALGSAARHLFVVNTE